MSVLLVIIRTSLAYRVASLSDVKFEARNVLDDNELREGIKKFSNWPTIPQLYVKGEFVGGCDVLWEAHEAGEFEGLVGKK